MTASTERGSSLSPLVRYITPIEIAASLRVDVKTVCRWLRDEAHPLKGTKVNNMWRVTPEDLKTFIEGEKQ